LIALTPPHAERFNYVAERSIVVLSDYLNPCAVDFSFDDHVVTKPNEVNPRHWNRFMTLWRCAPKHRWKVFVRHNVGADPANVRWLAAIIRVGAPLVRTCAKRGISSLGARRAQPMIRHRNHVLHRKRGRANLALLHIAIHDRLLSMQLLKTGRLLP